MVQLKGGTALPIRPDTALQRVRGVKEQPYRYDPTRLFSTCAALRKNGPDTALQHVRGQGLADNLTTAKGTARPTAQASLPGTCVAKGLADNLEPP